MPQITPNIGLKMSTTAIMIQTAWKMYWQQNGGQLASLLSVILLMKWIIWTCKYIDRRRNQTHKLLAQDMIEVTDPMKKFVELILVIIVLIH